VRSGLVSCVTDWLVLARAARLENGLDFVLSFRYKNELQHFAAHCCAYVQLQATTHVVSRAVRPGTRSQRARCEFHLA